MTPVKLTCIGIGANDETFVFDDLKDLYPINTAENLKQYVGYAFFGNESLYKGEIRFEFVYEDETYVIDRDFEKNTVSLKIGEKEIPDAEIEKRLADVIRITQGQWSEFGVASKHAAYEGITTDVEKYTRNVFADLKLTEETALASADEYRKEIEGLEIKAEVLKGLTTGCENGKERLAEIAAEIAQLEADTARVAEIISAGKIAETTAKKLDDVKELLEREKSKTTRIESDKKRLERSRAIKEHFTILDAVSKAEKEAESIKEELDSTAENEAKREAELVAGRKVHAKKEDEFLALNARVRALNEAFDEFIKENKESGKNDGYVTERLSEICKETDERIAALKAELEEKQAEFTSLGEKIKSDETELAEIRPTAKYRKAVREGACFEIAIKEKSAALAELEKSLEEDARTIKGLQDDYAYNEAELELCRENLGRVLTDGNVRRTPAGVINDYNDRERVKQALYRDQILSATLLQEIGAIDKKITENTDLKRNCAENRAALENAKETLVAYVKKCNDALNARNGELNDIKAEQKFYDGLDAIPYGAKCPVCSAPVSDKTDAEAAVATLRVKEAEKVKEIARLEGIAAEYAEKLDKINVRLGAYESTELTSTSYITSLEQTKKAKLATLNKLYEDNGVKNHEELTNALENEIALIARIGAAITDIKALTEIEERASKAVKSIKARLDEIEGKIVPEKKKAAEELRNDVATYEREFGFIKKKIDADSALALLDSVIATEMREDELYASLNESEAQSKELGGEIEGIKAEIAELGDRTKTFVKDGKELDYTELCIRVAADEYDEIVGEIRRTEQKRIKAQDEMIAIGRLLDDKQVELDEIKAKNDEKARRREVLLSYAKTLAASESYNAKLLEGTDYETVKGEILEEKAAASIEEEIASYGQAIVKYECEIGALTDVMEETGAAREALESNVAVAKELAGLLEDRTREYIELSNKINLDAVLEEKIAELGKEQAEAQKSLTDVESVIDGHASDLLITKINNSLSVLMPNLRVKLKGEKLCVLSTDRAGNVKELDRVDDEEYVAVSVSVINAVRQITGETINSAAPMRIVKVQANTLGSDVKYRLKAFGKNNNIIVILHK